MQKISIQKIKWDQNLIQKMDNDISYLSKDFDTDIAPPPEKGSIADIADRYTVQLLKKLRDEKNIERIILENKATNVMNAFEIRNLIRFQDNPKTKLFFEETHADLEYFILRDKMKFSRMRPDQIIEGIDPVIDTPFHASYPSGHAAQAYFIALVLSDLNPEMQNNYRDAAVNIGQLREIAGVHFPTDTAAGIILAQNVYKTLMKNEQVRLLFDDAKKEFEKQNNNT